MMWLAVGLVLCVTAPAVQGATDSFDWCYHDPSCDDDTWPVKAPQYCNGSRQSPIDILTPNATYNSNLTAFTFTNFDSTTKLTKIENTGKTVKVSFASGVGISGGDLDGTYDSLQFHLHWGKGASIPGSEHTVDGKRYPMEFHIVSIKSKYNGNTTEAVADSSGAAALGFFIEALNSSGEADKAWKTLTSYLSNITEKGQSVTVSDGMGISLNDLLPGINRKRYYRYLGSLTTPLCYEAVVWTVFKEPVGVSKEMIDLFANTVRIGNSTSAFMENVYRKIQPYQPVTHSASPKMTYSSGLFVLIVALWMR